MRRLWKLAIAGRMKVKQVLDSFQGIVGPEIGKYVCAPCSNCISQLSDLIEYYELDVRCSIRRTGLAELIVNAMEDTPVRYLDEEVVKGKMPACAPVESRVDSN